MTTFEMVGLLFQDEVPGFALVWLTGKAAFGIGVWGVFVSIMTFVRSPQIGDFVLKCLLAAAALAMVGEYVSDHAKWIADHPTGTGAIVAVIITIAVVGYIKVQEFVTYR